MRRLFGWVLVIVFLCPFAATRAGAKSLRMEDDADLHQGTYDAYFDDAVFVGDSIFQQLWRYVEGQRQQGRPLLGGARFMVAASYTIYQASRIKPDGAVQMRYRGREVSVSEGLRQMEAGKAVILLGLNDFAGSQMEKDVSRYGTMLERIRTSNPNIELFPCLMTPIVQRAQDQDLNQETTTAFNVRLLQLCQEKGLPCWDVASPLMDAQGFLNPDFSTDKRVHLNPEGFEVLIDTLRRFARDAYEQGQWDIPSGENT